MKAVCMLTLCLIVAVGSACRSPRPAGGPAEVRDAYFHRMITSGHAAFQRGDIARAAELYENAWVRAQVMDRPAMLAASAYNLALCQIALGELDAGYQLLRSAYAEMVRIKDPGVDALIAKAEVLRRLNRSEEAWAVSDRLLAESAPRPVRLQNHSLRALLALDVNNGEKAELELEQAHRQVRRQTPVRLLARVAEVEGRLALYNDDRESAAAAFDRAAMLYRDEGRFPDMARVLADAADLYAEMGSRHEAVDRYFRAARHHAAASEPVLGLRLLDAALRLLEESDLAIDGEPLVDLFGELQESVKIQRTEDVQAVEGDDQ